MGQSVSESVRQELRDKMDQPSLPREMQPLEERGTHGDLGTSYFFKATSPWLSSTSWWLPLELVFAAALIIVVISIPLGFIRR